MDSPIKIEKAMALMTHRRCFLFAELVAALCLLTFLPVAAKSSAAAFRFLLHGDLSAFLLCNAVILAVAFLSSAADRRNIPAESPHPEVLDLFLQDLRNIPEESENASVETKEKTEEAEMERVIAEADRKVRAYRRSRSDSYGGVAVERKELRRSETERKDRVRRMEDLSNEEFRSRIEAFISTQKCNLEKETECTTLALSFTN